MNVSKLEASRQREICIVINDKSQDSMAKHLSSDGLLYYKGITQLDIKKLLQSANIWRSCRQNGLLCHISHSPYTFVLKDAEFAR